MLSADRYAIVRIDWPVPDVRGVPLQTISYADAALLLGFYDPDFKVPPASFPGRHSNVSLPK